MKIRILVTAALFVLAQSIIQSVQAQEKEQPNIIFILVDDQGYGDIGVFHQNERGEKGLPYQRTPHLDRMAEEGGRFTHQYASSPVCAPSRASILTGMSQGHANVRDNQFDKALEENHSMASTLKNLGYHTAAIGKWGLQGDDMWEEGGSEWPAKPTNRSFDDFFGYMRHMDGHEHYPKEGIYGGTKEVWHNDEMITDKLDKSYTTDLWTAAAKKWIVDYKKSDKKDKPFFMYLAYDTPHAVMELPTQAYPEGGGLKGGVQWFGEDGHFINTASGEVDSYVYPEYDKATYDHDDNPDTPEVEWPETYKRYATSNRRIDDAVGDIMQLLKDLNIDENTLVVYTSDNGVSAETYLGDWQAKEERKLPTFFASYGPFDGIKRDTWEGGLRVPTIVHWPKYLKGGKVFEDPSVHYDWAPTFIEAAGGSVPARMDGVSLMPTLTEEGKQPESTIYMEYFFNGKTPSYKDFQENRRGQVQKHMQNIRLGDYMGVRYNVESAEDDFEIYNVKEDPAESENLLHSEKNLSIPSNKNIKSQDLNRLMKERVLQRRIPADDIERPYDDAPVHSVNEKVKKGLQWEFFPGEFSWLPKVENKKPSSKGQLAELDFEKISETKDEGVIVVSGYLKILEDGKYTFYSKPSHPTLIRLHDILLIDADYDFKENETKENTLHLKSGLHPITIYHKSGKSDAHKIDLEWKGPNGGKSIIPSENFFRSN